MSPLEELQSHNDKPAEGGRPPVTPCKRSAERSDTRSAAWGSEPHPTTKPAERRANEWLTCSHFVQCIIRFVEGYVVPIHARATSVLDTRRYRHGTSCIHKCHAADSLQQEFARNGRTEEGSPVRANAVSVVRGKRNLHESFESAERRTAPTRFTAGIRYVYMLPLADRIS